MPMHPEVSTSALKLVMQGPGDAENRSKSLHITGLELYNCYISVTMTRKIAVLFYQDTQ